VGGGTFILDSKMSIKMDTLIIMSIENRKWRIRLITF